MAYKTIIVETEDHITTIRLNRPDAMNALNSELLGELCAALAEADANDKVRCIILTGSEKAFAAGADINEMSEKSFAEVASQNYFAAEHQAIMAVRKPIIAAVAGYALGGGCELAMICDFIIAADTAKFGQPEINLGVIAGLGGSQRLTRFVGKSKSMEMNLTGRFMDADEAERSGLVSRVVPAKKLMEEATAAATKISEKSMLATMAVKEAVNRSYEVTLSEGLLFERRLFHSLFATEDQKEGMAAFLKSAKPSSATSNPADSGFSNRNFWRMRRRYMRVKPAQARIRRFPSGVGLMRYQRHQTRKREQKYGQYAPVQKARPSERAPPCREQGPPLAHSHTSPQSRRSHRIRRQGCRRRRSAHRSARTDARRDQRRLSQEHRFAQNVAAFRSRKSHRISCFAKPERERAFGRVFF